MLILEDRMTYYAVHVLRDMVNGRKKTWEASLLPSRTQADTIANELLSDHDVIFTEVWASEDRPPHNSRMLRRIER